MKRIASRQEKSGQLAPEPLSTDLENHFVDSVSGQIEAIEGLLALGRVWSSTGYSAQAAQARTLAQSINHALQPAVTRASKRLGNGALFVPDQLPQKPFARVTSSKDGSYWNLVMPYAFASGWFPAHSVTANGILAYLLENGATTSRYPRTDAHTVYNDAPGAGVAPVYGCRISLPRRQRQPDQLALSLYGMLAPA